MHIYSCSSDFQEASVPAKYGHINTTSLEITVTDDPAKNDLKLELVD